MAKDISSFFGAPKAAATSSETTSSSPASAPPSSSAFKSTILPKQLPVAALEVKSRGKRVTESTKKTDDARKKLKKAKEATATTGSGKKRLSKKKESDSDDEDATMFDGDDAEVEEQKEQEQEQEEEQEQEQEKEEAAAPASGGTLAAVMALANNTAKSASLVKTKPVEVAEVSVEVEVVVDLTKPSSPAKPSPTKASPTKPDAFSKLTSAAKAKEKSKPKPKTKTSTSTAEKKSTTLANNMKSDTNLFNSSSSSSSSTSTSSSSSSSSSATAPSWKENEPVSYLELVNTLQAIEETSARLEIQSLLTTFFRKVILKTPSDLIHCVYLAANDIAPSYECLELGVGDSFLIKAISEAGGVNVKIVKEKYQKEGDLGLVAQSSKAKQRTLSFAKKPKPLNILEVLTAYRKIARTSGTGTQPQKIQDIKGLLVRCSAVEAKFLIRGLQGKLRIGLAKASVLVAIAHSFFLSKKEFDDEKTSEVSETELENFPTDALTLYKCHDLKKTPLDEKLALCVEIIKKAHSELPNYDTIIEGGLTAPLYKLHEICCLKPGIPVEPMLAKPTKSVLEVLKRLEKQRFTCEYKYDGERAQVHMTPDGSFKVFSRNLLDTSDKFPEVPDFVKLACKESGVTSFVLDSEVVAYNSETDKLVPFQVLSTRKKELAEGEEASVKVIVQAFDLMYLNGESLLNMTLSDRRDLLHKNFKPIENKFRFAVALDHTEDGDTEMIEEFLDKAVKGQCEGLMVKTLDENAKYEPSKRSLNWLKLKKDYLEGLGDSVDLVPIGAFYGKGKRTGTYGAYLLACYDPESDVFQSVCKIGTGFSDEALVSLMEGLAEHKTDNPSSQFIFGDSLKCDVWFDPVQVWEVKAADLSCSSTHKGALGRVGEGPDRGIGLRFPRFERLRPDKKCEQATSSDQIRDLFYNQDSMIEANKEVEGYDDDDEL